MLFWKESNWKNKNIKVLWNLINLQNGYNSIIEIKIVCIIK